MQSTKQLLACAAAALLAATVAPARADDVVGTAPLFEPHVERRTIDEADIHARDIELGLFGGLISVEDFGSSPLLGGSIGYHLTEDFFVEGAYGAAKAGKTSFERLAGDVQLLTDSERKFSFYDLSLGYHLLPGESFIGSRHAFNSAMYLIGGIGATEFAGDRSFTWNFGAGYRVILLDWLALRAEVRDHVFTTDVTGDDKITHNIDLHLGMSFFF